MLKYRVNKDIAGHLEMKFNEEFSLLEHIFCDTVLLYESKNDWLKGIDDTIDGTLVNGDFGVQSGFGAEVGTEKTIIYCDFTDDEINISTQDFKKISKIWFDELEKFKETGEFDATIKELD